MGLKRRDFLKTLAGGAALAAVPQDLQASEPPGRRETHLGMLYDSTLCIGCQDCMNACKKVNNLPPVKRGPLSIWENPKGLSSKTMNIIKKYESGTRDKKDRVLNGFAFVKRQCLHCVDPACVSACPASAMTKEPETGIVMHDKDACIGCRYCQVACQFNIPRFQWEEPFPQIVKCQMCSPLVARGKTPACCVECPTGATVFGPVPGLLEEIKRRQAMTPGTLNEFPLSALASGKIATHRSSAYIPQVYGDTEIGGTQVLYLSGIPFDLLGLPDLPDKSYVSISEGIQHTLYKGMIAPLVLLGGLMFVVKKNHHD